MEGLGEGGERASLKMYTKCNHGDRLSEYYVTMETNLHFTSPDSFCLAVRRTTVGGVSAGIRWQQLNKTMNHIPTHTFTIYKTHKYY